MALMNYFLVMNGFNQLQKSLALELSFLYRYFVRGLDRLIFDDKFINECVLSSSPGDSHFGLHSKHNKYFYNQLVPGLRNIPFPGKL